MEERPPIRDWTDTLIDMFGYTYSEELEKIHIRNLLYEGEKNLLGRLNSAMAFALANIGSNKEKKGCRCTKDEKV